MADGSFGNIQLPYRENCEDAIRCGQCNTGHTTWAQAMECTRKRTPLVWYNIPVAFTGHLPGDPPDVIATLELRDTEDFRCWTTVLSPKGEHVVLYHLRRWRTGGFVPDGYVYIWSQDYLRGRVADGSLTYVYLVTPIEG